MMEYHPDIYTDLPLARDEVRRRWGDEPLKREVAAYLGEVPVCFAQQPRAVLWRNIITPDHELLNFLDLARGIELQPLGLEFTEDRFCTRNGDKMCLGKMALFQGTDRHGEIVMRHRKVIDVKRYDNARFSAIETLDGDRLVDFHHGLVRKRLGAAIEIQDISQWIEAHGTVARDYYRKVLAFFVCHGVLFESFVTDIAEADFEREVVLPAIAHVQGLFGLKPLIVPVIPDPRDRYWWCYPGDVLEEAHP